MDENVIPKILENNKGTIKIWSAACSTGDEPYSLAMAFSKHVPLSRIKITATDIDKQVIQHAQVGLYNAKSIAGVPADLKKKYFTQVGTSYQISDEILAKLEDMNLYLIKNFRLAFGNRINKQIRDYVPCYIACGGTEIDGIDFIFFGRNQTTFGTVKIFHFYLAFQYFFTKNIWNALECVE